MSHLIFQLSDFLKITNAEKIFHNFVAECNCDLFDLSDVCILCTLKVLLRMFLFVFWGVNNNGAT